MKRAHRLSIFFLVGFFLLGVVPGCVSPDRNREPVSWALAIHGGAGVIASNKSEREKEAYRVSLEEALRIGEKILEAGGTGLDAVEQVIRFLEDDEKFNAGKGAVFNSKGGHELDASFMDGNTLESGAVTGVTTVKHPITLARLVKEKTRHILLAGRGAEEFAGKMGLEPVTQQYFYTEKRFRSWRKAVESEKQTGHPGERERSTVGCVALDRHGNLAAGTSTGGLTNKQYGRVGDSPIIGAGTYANNRTCAISCTGTGELFMRHRVAGDISSMMEYLEISLEEAAHRVIHHTLSPGDGGLIGVDRHGSTVMVFNTEGMFRGAADSSGRREVKIWK